MSGDSTLLLVVTGLALIALVLNGRELPTVPRTLLAIARTLLHRP